MFYQQTFWKKMCVVEIAMTIAFWQQAFDQHDDTINDSYIQHILKALCCFMVPWSLLYCSEKCLSAKWFLTKRHGPLHDSFWRLDSDQQTCPGDTNLKRSYGHCYKTFLPMSLLFVLHCSVKITNIELGWRCLWCQTL